MACCKRGAGEWSGRKDRQKIESAHKVAQKRLGLLKKVFIQGSKAATKNNRNVCKVIFPQITQITAEKDYFERKVKQIGTIAPLLFFKKRRGWGMSFKTSTKIFAR